MFCLYLNLIKVFRLIVDNNFILSSMNLWCKIFPLNKDFKPFVYTFSWWLWYPKICGAMSSQIEGRVLKKSWCNWYSCCWYAGDQRTDGVKRNCWNLETKRAHYEMVEGKSGSQKYRLSFKILIQSII